MFFHFITKLLTIIGCLGGSLFTGDVVVSNVKVIDFGKFQGSYGDSNVETEPWSWGFYQVQQLEGEIRSHSPCVHFSQNQF